MTGTPTFNEVFFTDVRVPVDQIVRPRRWLEGGERHPEA